MENIIAKLKKSNNTGSQIFDITKNDVKIKWVELWKKK